MHGIATTVTCNSHPNPVIARHKRWRGPRGCGKCEHVSFDGWWWMQSSHPSLLKMRGGVIGLGGAWWCANMGGGGERKRCLLLETRDGCVGNTRPSALVLSNRVVVVSTNVAHCSKRGMVGLHWAQKTLCPHFEQRAGGGRKCPSLLEKRWRLPWAQKALHRATAWW